MDSSDDTDSSKSDKNEEFSPQKKISVKRKQHFREEKKIVCSQSLSVRPQEWSILDGNLKKNRQCPPDPQLFLLVTQRCWQVCICRNCSVTWLSISVPDINLIKFTLTYSTWFHCITGSLRIFRFYDFCIIYIYFL